MAKAIAFRAIIEILGKPKEHVDQSLKEYIQRLKEDERYEVSHVSFADLKKQEDEEMWATFAEADISTESVDNIISFCFDYMPSLLEILKPESLTLSAEALSLFLNDLQARLHQVDMIAKKVKLDNDFLKHNQSNLLKNYIMVLLKANNFTSEQLSSLTGVGKDKLEDYLDQLIDEGKINLKKGLYYAKGQK